MAVCFTYAGWPPHPWPDESLGSVLDWTCLGWLKLYKRLSMSAFPISVDINVDHLVQFKELHSNAILRHIAWDSSFNSAFSCLASPTFYLCMTTVYGSFYSWCNAVSYKYGFCFFKTLHHSPYFSSSSSSCFFIVLAGSNDQKIKLPLKTHKIS